MGNEEGRAKRVNISERSQVIFMPQDIKVTCNGLNIGD